MATIVPITEWIAKEVVKITWEGMSGGDVAQRVQIPNFKNNTVSFTGSFGGGFIGLFGSNVSTPTTMTALMACTGGNLTVVLSDKFFCVQDTPQYIAPEVTAMSTDGDVDIIFISAGG